VVAAGLWWWGSEKQAVDELERSHLALVLPADLDGGEVADVVIVYARLTQEGSSVVEAVRGEDQTTLWSTEVAGMGVAETHGVRTGVAGGVIALASRRPEGAQMMGQITVLNPASGAELWTDTNIPEPCGGFWTQLTLRGDTLVAFCRSDQGHAIRSYDARTGEIRFDESQPGEILETAPVFLPGMVFLPDPVHGRWFRLDGKSSEKFQTPGQVYIDGQHLVYTHRDEECASKYRLERLNRAGQSEILEQAGPEGCLPDGMSPFRPLGWSPSRIVGIDEEGALVGVSDGESWRLEFPDRFRHRGLFYEHKRRATELSALHRLTGIFHPFIIRKEEGEVEQIRLAVVNLDEGTLSWQSDPVESTRPWISRHILRIDDQYMILIPDGESTHLLVLDSASGLFADAVELQPQQEGINSSVLSHHLLEVHLYPERFSQGRLYGSARDRVFSVDLSDWSVHAYRGDPIRVDKSWDRLGELLGELPRRP
jgi:hypothetical protein